MKTTTHVIYVAYEPLTQKSEQEYYIKRVIAENFEVEYWDLSFLYHKNLIMPDTLGYNYVKSFFTFKQLEQEVEKYKSHAFFIFAINYYSRVFTLFRIFSKYNCYTAFFARGMIPFPLLKKGGVEKIVKKIIGVKNLLTYKNLILNRLSGLAKHVNIIKPFSIVFFAGNEGIRSVGYGSEIDRKKAHLIPVNAVDYDKHLALKKSNTKILDYRYCVFLDDYLPYHPDFDILKIPKVNACDYYNSLNFFFDKIESAYNIKVVIAAHPKSDYSNKNAFLHRTVIKHKTAELVKDSEFVMAHISTSISFAVLFRKPILFLYNNAIIKTYPDRHYPYILHFAEILNAQAVNVDNVHTENFSLKTDSFDGDCYVNYKHNYLTSAKSEENTTEEIFVSYLKSLK